MPSRIAALVLTLTGCLYFASAFPTEAGPDEDPRDCPTPKKGEPIVKFPCTSPETQKLVLDFRASDKLPGDDATRWGYTAEAGTPKIGEKDGGNPPNTSTSSTTPASSRGRVTRPGGRTASCPTGRTKTGSAGRSHRSTVRRTRRG